MQGGKDSVENPNATKPRVVCCIGDIHGYLAKLQNLWSNLESLVDPSDFKSALIIFLGDYCDRGPDTGRVLDFLISLPSKYPNQSHVFLCGNHDLAFAAFLGVLPKPPDGSALADTWKEFEMSEEREGWYKGEGYENMHVQGRRWAGKHTVAFNVAKGTSYQGSIYDAAPTFESYGVPHGSADLMKAVPDEHKKFLADTVWIHEEELTKTPTIVVSGHHGKLHIEGLRLIIDQGGGLENNPVAAMILPSMKIVRDTDCFSQVA